LFATGEKLAQRRYFGGNFLVLTDGAVVYYPAYHDRLLRCRAGAVLCRDRFLWLCRDLAPDAPMPYHKACAAAGLLRACSLYCAVIYPAGSWGSALYQQLWGYAFVPAGAAESQREGL